MVFRSIQEYKKKYKFVNIESSFEELPNDIQQLKDKAAQEMLLEDETAANSLWIKVSFFYIF